MSFTRWLLVAVIGALTACDSGGALLPSAHGLAIVSGDGIKE